MACGRGGADRAPSITLPPWAASFQLWNGLRGGWWWLAVHRRLGRHLAGRVGAASLALPLLLSPS